MKKVFASALVFGLFFFGCNSSDCGKVKKYYDIQGISLLNYSYKPLYGNYSMVSDSVNYLDYALGFGFSTTYYAHSAQKFSLIPEAFASEDCMVPGEAGTKEKITEIQLIALADFNSTYKAGDTINEMVTITPNGISGVHPETTLAAYLEQAKVFIPADNNLIRFTQKPNPKVKQAFRIIMKLDNGETYTAETTPIKIF